MNTSTVVAALIVITVATVVRGAGAPNKTERENEIIDHGVYRLPKGILAVGAKGLDRNQLLARRNSDGKWQVLRVRRFVWQEPLIVVPEPEDPHRAVSETLTTNSIVPANQGVYAVIEVAPTLFDTNNDIKIDEAVRTGLANSDDILIAARKLRSPDFIVVAPAAASSK